MFTVNNNLDGLDSILSNLVKQVKVIGKSLNKAIVKPAAEAGKELVESAKEEFDIKSIGENIKKGAQEQFKKNEIVKQSDSFWNNPIIIIGGAIGVAVLISFIKKGNK